jgi:cytochrome b6-f complex iron-sulfur subunit
MGGIMDIEKSKLSRRSFLGIIIGFFSVLWSAMAAYPLLRYLTPPKTTSQLSNVTSLTVAEVKDIPIGTGQNFQFGSIPAILTHTREGEFHAFSAVCSHLGCTVQFNPDAERITCACHGGQYDPTTGKNLAGPPPKPLTSLKAEVKDGKVVVSRA